MTQVMLFGKIIAVYCASHMRSQITAGEQIVGLKWRLAEN
jgi:hypothetical protein